MLPTNDTNITQYKDPNYENLERMKDIIQLILKDKKIPTLTTSQKDAYYKELKLRSLKDGGAEMLLKHNIINQAQYMQITENRIKIAQQEKQEELNDRIREARNSDYTKQITSERAQLRNERRQQRLQRDLDMPMTIYQKPEPRIRIPKHVLPEKTKKPFYPKDMVNRAYNKMARQQKMEIVQYVPKGLEVQNVPQIPDNPPFNPLTIIKNTINAATGIVQPLMEGISKVTNIPQLSTVGGAMEYGITKLVNYLNPIPMEIEHKVVNKPPLPQNFQQLKTYNNIEPITQQDVINRGQIKNKGVQPMQIEPPKQQQMEIINQLPQNLEINNATEYSSSFTIPQTEMPYGRKKKYTKRFSKFRKNRINRGRTKRSNRKRNYDYQIKIELEAQVSVTSSGLTWSSNYNDNHIGVELTQLYIDGTTMPEIIRFAPIFSEYSIRKVKYHYRPNIISRSEVTTLANPNNNNQLETTVGGFRSGFMLVDSKKLNPKFINTQTYQDIAKSKTCKLYSLDNRFSFSEKPCLITGSFNIQGFEMNQPVPTNQDYDTTASFKKKKCPWMKFDAIGNLSEYNNFYLGQYTTIQSMNISTSGETVVPKSPNFVLGYLTKTVYVRFRNDKLN